MNKFTIEQVMIFRANAQKYIQQKAKERTKFTYALEKMIAKTSFVEKRLSEYNQDASVEFASVDDKGNILIVNERMQFTKDNQKALTAKIRKYMQGEIEVETYEAAELPEDLGADWEEVLLPFVGKKLKVSEEEKAA